ncbi:MAG: flagellar basal body P-ring formation chaperone FlgA [Burkholderiaceae bacterium]
MRIPNRMAAVITAATLLISTPPAFADVPVALQDPAIVATEVEAFLLTQAQSLPGIPTVTVTPPRIGRQSACEHLDTFLTNPQLRSRMSVGVRCLTPQPWTLYVQAAVGIQGHYYVASRSINVGEPLSLEDLTAREGDLLRLANGVVTDPALAIGYIAQQRIAAGSTVRSSALRDPDSVVRGQAVRTEARGVGFVATGEGVALESGAPGSMIQVRTSSGQVVTGTVVNNTTIRVLM